MISSLPHFTSSLVPSPSPPTSPLSHLTLARFEGSPFPFKSSLCPQAKTPLSPQSNFTLPSVSLFTTTCAPVILSPSHSACNLKGCRLCLCGIPSYFEADCWISVVSLALYCLQYDQTEPRYFSEIQIQLFVCDHAYLFPFDSIIYKEVNYRRTEGRMQVSTLIRHTLQNYPAYFSMNPFCPDEWMLVNNENPWREHIYQPYKKRKIEYISEPTLESQAKRMKSTVIVDSALDQEEVFKKFDEMHSMIETCRQNLRTKQFKNSSTIKEISFTLGTFAPQVISTLEKFSYLLDKFGEQTDTEASKKVVAIEGLLMIQSTPNQTS
eukprot:TRINITY_DN3538_c0_g1_i1.p1 TRINITY_DN3538_c0_g1~~TRINITY_DN3538_c0_g1_i1.p1  ORF type:complete len:323 (-),score=28.37 TRINITY_DN3538_c0_g1_i1:94-1062(-)